MRDELPRTHTEDLVFYYYYYKRLVRLFFRQFFSNFPFAFVATFQVVLDLNKFCVFVLCGRCGQLQGRDMKQK